MIKKTFLFFILLFILNSCATGTPPNIIGTPRFQRDIFSEAVVEDTAEETGPQVYSVLFRGETAEPGKYEPADGIYIGAWLNDETDIRMFEHLTEKRHAVYVNEITLGDDIPVSWLLHCIASVSTPLFIVHPPENPELEDINEINLLIHLAQRLGSFNLPMFIVLYPEDHGMMPAEYTLFFRSARNVFLNYAPMAAFVWAAPDYSSTSQNPFYPGHSVVDWVALPLLSEWDGENFSDVLHEFDIFYDTFCDIKPIMVLPLGVSHYTRRDYTYRMNEAAEEISRIYNALQNYPRLGLIVYADAFTLSRAYSGDFSVSYERVLTDAYINGINKENYLSALERKPVSYARWVRSSEIGYVWENRIFISESAMENEILISPRQTVEINGNNFCEVSERNITICTERRVIYVDNFP